MKAKAEKETEKNIVQKEKIENYKDRSTSKMFSTNIM